MNKKKRLLFGFVLSFFFFLIALILFNEASFLFIGLGVITMGIFLLLYINSISK